MLLLRCWAHNAIDGADQFVPAAGLRSELLPAGGCQPVIPCFAIVFRSAPEGRDPPTVFQPMQGGIKRAMFHFKDILGAALNCVRDGMSVRRTKLQRS